MPQVVWSGELERQGRCLDLLAGALSSASTLAPALERKRHHPPVTTSRAAKLRAQFEKYQRRRQERPK